MTRPVDPLRLREKWLRDFSWLTARRVKFYSGVLLLAYLAAAIGQLFHSHHLIFESGACVGGDFVNLYAASIAALKGDPASVYDIHRQHLQEVAVMAGKDSGVLGFHYPPMFLLIVLPLSTLPFVASWVVFEAVTLAGYLAVLRRIAPVPLGLWLAITFPAVIINFMCGQNGFLTTALIGGGLLLLDRCPLLAGLLFGLMAYKPQFAILIPLALIVARLWRALIATAISTILFAAASLAVFGAPAWRAFAGSIAFTQKIVLERVRSISPPWKPFLGQSGCGWKRQCCVCVSGGGCDIRGVCGGLGLAAGRPFALKGATLAVGSLMVSPYVLQYDLVLLALPIAWLAMEVSRRGSCPMRRQCFRSRGLCPASHCLSVRPPKSQLLQL